MALLDFPFNLLAAHPFAGAFAHPLHRVMRACADEPDVAETDDGYLFSAHVPGVNAADIAIKATAHPGASSATLSVKAPGAFDHTFRLPAARADLANITASCIDGILRIAVPKNPVCETAVPVVDASPSSDSDASDAVDEFTVRVPGFAPSDISVVVKSTGQLLVEGKSERGGCFKQRLGVDRAVDPGRISASCADGLLTIAVARGPEHAELAVPVAAHEAPAAMDADADAAPAARVTLIRQPVPGVAADNVSVTSKDGVVRASVKADQSSGSRCRFRRLAFEARLPAGVDASSLAAACEHGVLTVTCGAPAPPEEFEVMTSAERLACLGPDEGREGKGKETAE